MNLVELRQAALDAQRIGENARTRAMIESAGGAAAGDPLLLQLLALVSDQPADASALYQYAAADSDAADAEAWFNLGVTEQTGGQLDRAVLRYEQALRLDPRHQGALNNLSDILRLQGRRDEAWWRLNAYLASGAETRGQEIRIAKIADDCGRPDEARCWFEAAAERFTHDPAVEWEHAQQQLRDEEFAAGWANFEHRRNLFPHQALAIVSYSMPEWDGGPLNGQSLLVHKEQGLGDVIMFASCLADLPCDGGDLHLAVQPQLARLFAANFPQAQVWSSVSSAGQEDESWQHWRTVSGPIDCQVPFGTLPLHLRARGFPVPRKYLDARDEDIAAWRARIDVLAPTPAGHLRCGIVTVARRDGVTGPGIVDGHGKSFPAAVGHHFDLPSVSWFGLHDRANADELGRLPISNLFDASDWLFDLADTAGLLACLDVVVAVDTSVAHLAAAMGKKVLLMLRRNADWRWGRTREDSYWYPDVEVFRQSHEGDWAPVAQAVAARIAGLSRRQGRLEGGPGGHQ